MKQRSIVSLGSLALIVPIWNLLWLRMLWNSISRRNRMLSALRWVMFWVLIISIQQGKPISVRVRRCVTSASVLRRRTTVLMMCLRSGYLLNLQNLLKDTLFRHVLKFSTGMMQKYCTAVDFVPIICCIRILVDLFQITVMMTDLLMLSIFVIITNMKKKKEKRKMRSGPLSTSRYTIWNAKTLG